MTVESPQIHSFDVFDTVLMRKVAHPTDVFHLVAERLVSEGILPAREAARWPGERVAAEQDARRATRQREVSHAEILRCLCARLDLDIAVADVLAQIELEIEFELLVVVPGAGQAIETARRAGHRVAFTSDMYVPASFIRAALERHHLIRPGDALFVSSESGATKARGDLFALVQRHFHAPARRIHHRGDNRRSDYLVPRRLGINASLIAATKLTRYEAMVADATELPVRARSLLAGAARLTRLTIGIEEPRRALARVACGVIAPLMLMFVAWLSRTAREASVDRLFFLARDGQMPFRIATAAAERFAGLALPSAHYLYASRQAWHPAAMRELDAHDLRWLFADHSNRLTLERVAHRCNIDPAALVGALPPGIVLSRGAVIGANQRADLTCALAQPGPARSMILEQAAASRERVLRYLRQQGADAQSAALVDIGWHGSLQASYERILTGCADASPSTAFYFGLLSRPALHRDSVAQAWFIDRSRSRLRDWLCAVEVLEQFFEADHGTTRGYDDRNGTVTPRLAEPANVAALRWGLAIQHRAVEMTCRQFLADAGAADLEALSAPGGACLVERLLDAFIHSPGRDEAAFYGMFPKTSNQDHDDPRALAPPLRFTDALRAALGLAPDAALPTRWVGGSLVQSDVPLTMLRRARLRASSSRAHRKLVLSLAAD